MCSNDLFFDSVSTIKVSFSLHKWLPQVGWTWHEVLPVREVLDHRLYNLTHRLFSAPFAFGAFAYIISRRGMELVLDKYMTDRTRRSTLASPRPDPIELWFDWVRNVIVVVDTVRFNEQLKPSSTTAIRRSFAGPCALHDLGSTNDCTYWNR